MCAALIASHFFMSKRAGVRVHPPDVEGLDHLRHGEDVAVVGDPPAEQREVVEQTLRQEPLARCSR